jgi:hypothetical protein
VRGTLVIECQKAAKPIGCRTSSAENLFEQYPDGLPLFGCGFGSSGPTSGGGFKNHSVTRLVPATIGSVGGYSEGRRYRSRRRSAPSIARLRRRYCHAVPKSFCRRATQLPIQATRNTFECLQRDPRFNAPAQLFGRTSLHKFHRLQSCGRSRQSYSFATRRMETNHGL